jgi:branched-chain amino acid transport system substrate-binding protein
MAYPPRRISIGLRILRGSFETGFGGELGIWRRNQFRFDRQIQLPVSPEVLESYEDWRTAYRAISGTCAPISVSDQIVAGIGEDPEVERFNRVAERFQERLGVWFSRPEFQAIKSQIETIKAQERIADRELVPIFFEILDTRQQDRLALKALPWHLWDLFESDQFEAVIFSSIRIPVSERNSRREIIRLQFPDVLTIFGSNRGGLQLERDRQTWQQVKNSCSEIHSIPTPIDVVASGEQVNAEMVVRSLSSACHILFFAGHSASDSTFQNGSLELNPTEKIQVSQLRQSLNRAVGNGLLLAIFNSCDGIGIANFLADRGVPYIIVMRERIPDEAARQFLVHFLEEFSQGLPVYLAVKRARQKLEGAEFFASWLPVTFQHPASPDLVWANSAWAKLLNLLGRIVQRLCQKVSSIVHGIINWRPRWALLLLLGITTALMAVLMTPPLIQFVRTDVVPVAQAVWRSVAGGSSDNLISIGATALPGDKETDANRAFKVALGQYDNSSFSEAIDQAVQQFEAELKPNIEAGLRNKNKPLSWVYFNNAIVERETRANSALRKLVIATTASKGDLDQTLRGVALAQTAFNCGTEQFKEWNGTAQCAGKKGYLLEVAVSRYENETVSQVAKKISEYTTPDSQKPAVTVGRYTSENIEAAAQEFQGKLVLIAPTSNAVRNPPEGSGGDDTVTLDPKWVFRMVPDVNFVAQRLDDHIGAVNAEAAGMFYASPENKSDKKAVFSTSLASAIRSEINPDVFEPPPGQSLDCNLLSQKMNIQGCLQEAARKNVKMLLLVPESGNLGKVLEVIGAVKPDSVNRLIGADTMYDDSILRKVEKLNGLSGVEIEIMTPWARSPEETPTLDRSYIEQAGVNLFATSSFNWRTATAYDSTLTALQGILNVLSKNQPLSAASLSTELSSETFKLDQVEEIPTATGEIAFDKGDRQHRPDLQRFVKVVCQSSPVKCDFK